MLNGSMVILSTRSLTRKLLFNMSSIEMIEKLCYDMTNLCITNKTINKISMVLTND